MSRNPLRACLVAVALAAGFLAQADISATAADKSVVFSFGDNGSGRTGQGTDEGNTLVATPIDTTNLMGETITEVATGAAHSLLVTEDGTVFSFGSNWQGSTGLGTDIGFALVATPIDTTNLAGKTITRAAGGSGFSLLLADDGTVFSFGENYEGQNGQGIHDDKGTLVATPIDTTNLAGTAITQVAAGYDHGLLLADDGAVFAFGKDDYGEIGQGTSHGYTLVATPIVTSGLAGKAITQMAAGEHFSLLLADDGTVFGFGKSDWGQAGLGPSLGSRIATPIDTTNLAGKTITQVTADRYHSLLLADDGTVFSMGMDSEGRTGLGLSDWTQTLVATPIDTTNLAGKTITQVAAGNRHSLLLADDGTVFSFGSNSRGQTGLGFASTADTLVATPIDMTNLAGLRVTDIFAGKWYSMLLAVPVSTADFDTDGDVDGDDFLAWQGGFGTLTGAEKSDGDYDNDGDVDGADFLGWQMEFGSGSGSANAAVPEPSTGIMLMLGMVTMLAGRRTPVSTLNCA